MRIEPASTGTPTASSTTAAQNFERAFVVQLAKQLQETASGDDESLGAYKDLLPEALADAVIQAGGLGLFPEARA